MARAGMLRDASQMIGPAIEAMFEALNPPVEDLPLVAIARRQAAVIDAMPDAVAVGMLPNHAGPLIKVLGELETRAAKRRKPAAAGNPVRAMRQDWAAKARGRAG